MTITEKILSAHNAEGPVTAGQFAFADADVVLGNDITAPLGIQAMKQAGIERVFDPTKVLLLADHFTPNKDIKSATQSKLLRDFAAEQGLTHTWDVGTVGIEHTLLIEEGLVGPGDLVVGADSHTVTYGAVGAFSTGVGSTDLAAAMATGKVWLRVPATVKFVYTGTMGEWICGKDVILHTIARTGVDGCTYMAMEFTGPVIGDLTISDRVTMCNMAIEAGAKNGIVAPDTTTRQYCEGRCERPFTEYASDADAEYRDVIEIDVTGLSPQVAYPPLPSGARPVDQCDDLPMDQVVVGSCTNGRIEDLRMAAKVLGGHKVAAGTRMIVIPATPRVWRRAMEEGLFELFVDAGAVISPPTCGPCLGGHMGVLAAGERCAATTNRNFVGRMGHPESEVYLCSPAVAAATAVTGRLTHPKDVCGR
jgi:3-isopropylmalate/(R)-2-methylmalate dehydratase large subunit